MKKIDWDNLEYDDFIGFVGVAAFLIYALYFGTLWYVTYDYRIETRDQMIETYQHLSDPIPSIKDDYGIHQKMLVYFVSGTRTFERDLTDDELEWYGEQLLSRGWKIDKKYTENNKYGTFTRMNLSKGEFIFVISRCLEKNTCRFHLIKEDWIYDKGF
ncbi:MAG: hypothetical protein ACLR1D_04480 [Dialister sp.]